MADKPTEYYKIAFSDTSAPIHRLSTWCGYDSKQHAYIKSLCEAWRDINSCDSLLYSTSCPNPMAGGSRISGGWRPPPGIPVDSLLRQERQKFSLWTGEALLLLRIHKEIIIY